MAAGDQNPKLEPPNATREGMTHQFQDGTSIDLTSGDWDATDSALNPRGKIPRALWSNAEGNISIVPVQGTSALTIYVKPGPVPWAVKKINRAGCDVVFQAANKLIAGF